MIGPRGLLRLVKSKRRLLAAVFPSGNVEQWLTVLPSPLRFRMFEPLRVPIEVSARVFRQPPPQELLKEVLQDLGVLVNLGFFLRNENIASMSQLNKILHQPYKEKSTFLRIFITAVFHLHNFLINNLINRIKLESKLLMRFKLRLVLVH